MNAPLRIRDVRTYRIEIPMRVRFEHAAAVRAVADPVILQIGAGAPYAHHVGFGETLARPYVTGETPESVFRDIASIFLPRLESFCPTSFAEALEFLEEMPFSNENRIIHAARTAVELALLDLAGRAFGRRPADVAGWMGLPGFGPPGCVRTARYSGIVVGRSPAKLKRFLRVQRYYGLRDFKLKIAVDGWQDRLRWAAEVLGPAIRRGRAALRVDANGGFDLADAHDAIPLLRAVGVCAWEQPFPGALDSDLPWLAEQGAPDIVADESLVSREDAKRLIAGGGVRIFNVRLAKHGGLLPSLRIASLALQAGLNVQLGCLVGETSILSAAGIGFLTACPSVRFVEGAFGRFLLRDEIVRRPICFGYGGRVQPPRGNGLGVEVDPARLERLAVDRARPL